MATQKSQTQMKPEEAKASLGTATHLQSLLLPQGQPQGSQTQNSAPQDDLKAQMATFMQQVQQTIKTEIGGLAKEIQTVIDEDKKEDVQPKA